MSILATKPAVQATEPADRTAKPAAGGFQAAFIVSWLVCLVFYFMEYAVRSAPSVMLPELTKAFGLSTVGRWYS